MNNKALNGLKNVKGPKSDIISCKLLKVVFSSQKNVWDFFSSQFPASREFYAGNYGIIAK